MKWLRARRRIEADDQHQHRADAEQ
jgi:hypothetical protein